MEKNGVSCPPRPPLVLIEAGRGVAQYWRDLWRFRELLYFFVWRDLLVRYKQTLIGVAWSVVRPVLAMVVFTVVFGRIGRFPAGGVPYPVLVFAALLPWQLFSTALQESSASLVGNANLVTKVFFPRILLPASAILVCLADFLISLAVLAGLMAWYGHAPDWRWCLALPLFLALALLCALGAGLWVAALNVKYRDFRYVVPFLAQLGLYLSPVGFSSAVIPERWRLWYSLNPMVGVIDGFRLALLGGSAAPYWPGLLLSLVLSAVLLLLGLRYFRATERSFADTI